jgi:prolipoprotein diacylglyceryltransferase
MTFPVWITLGPWRVHPHVVFEGLAYLIGIVTFFFVRRIRVDSVTHEQRWSLVTAVFIGAVIGSRALAWWDDPAARAHGLAGVMEGKTLVGGLIGGWSATEVQKRRLGLRQSTGDLYVFPLAIGIAIGRVGCLLSGLPDGTYGTQTSLPWGIDFGDGLARHPTALYESLFMIGLGLVLRYTTRDAPPGHMFKLFMASYLAFRLLVDTIKPGVALALGLTAIQWACVAGLTYYSWWFFRERVRA